MDVRGLCKVVAASRTTSEKYLVSTTWWLLAVLPREVLVLHCEMFGGCWPCGEFRSDYVMSKTWAAVGHM